MKKLSIILFLIFIVSGMAIAQQKTSLTFKKNMHDFGKIKEELGAVTTEFEFSNTGNTPVIIQRVNTSCGCTTPTYTREPILPGKKGKVIVKYSTVGRAYPFNKNVTVYTNVPDTVYILTIKGNVTPKSN